MPMIGKTHTQEWKDAASKRMSGKNNPSWKGGCIKECVVCGKEYHPKGERKKTAKFCSNSCKGKYYTQFGLKRGKNNGVWNGGADKEHQCAWCGDTFTARTYGKYKALYCSNECKGKYMQAYGLVTLGRHPLWKGGTSFLPYCEKFDEPLKEKTRNTYGRHCMLCGKHESELKSRLDVHHIDHNKDQGCSGKIWYLIPLCRSCHMKTNYKQEMYQPYFEKLIKDLEKWQPF